MQKVRLIFILATSLIGPCYGQAITAKFAATHVSGNDSVLFSAISCVPCEQIRVTHFDARVTFDSDSAHYGLTDFIVVGPHYGFRFFEFDFPSFKNTLEVDSVMFPIAMAEIRFPFERNVVRVGILQGFLPKLKGSLEGQSVSFRHGDLRGGYAGFSRDDFSCVAYWGALRGDVFASLVNLGPATAYAGLVMAQWKQFGVFGAVADGDTALVSKYLVSFFTGHDFSVEGNLCARAVGLWGNADRSFGPLTAGVFGLAGFVWSSKTEIHYLDTWKEAGVPQEDTRTYGADFSPAGIILLYPSLSWRMSQTLSVRASRFIPVAWGWDLEQSGDEKSESGISGSGDALDSLSAETLLLSGLTISAKFTFR